MLGLRGRSNEWKFWSTLVSGFLETLFITGICYGWASLVYVLKIDGYFSGYCVNATGEEDDGVFADCSGQDEQFTLIMYITFFINIMSRFPAGIIFDCWGTTATRITAICLHVTGTLFISLSNTDTSFLLYPALPCLLTSGSIFHITNTQVGNLFQSHRSTIITIYNGAYDSSAAILLFVKLLHEGGVSFHTSFLFLTLCGAGLLLRTLFLMPRGHIPYPLPENFSYGLGCPGRRRQTNKEEEEMTEPEVKSSEKDQRGEAETSASHLSTTLPEPTQEKEMTFRSCLLSWLYLWHLVWLSTNLFCQSHFLAHINPILEQLTDNDQELVSHHTNVLAIVQLLGLLSAPINGLIMDRHKNKPLAPGESMREADLHSSSLAFLLTALQCFLYCVCFTCPVLPLQYLTFVLQVVNSVSFYGCHYVFISFAFPASHFGKISGITMSLSALVLLLQFPIQYLVQNQLQGDLLYVSDPRWS
ncbi:solute carrier family 43 member 3a [Brachionichthys hirsutus]|uniref:solute carrier family 43 member 3a n=1 Tax=Brachionichthys hirsutus TaxID=412623 RepID=UPI003604EE9F